MSVNDIVNYVRTTPGNTNPSVVRSMVEGQIGEYVEEASNQALQKLGIKEEPAKTLCILELVDGFARLDKRIFLEVGTTYTVDINGDKYTVVTFLDEASNAVCLGNGASIGYPGAADTGEPFFASEVYDDNWCVIAMAPGISGKLTISTAETITPIDSKYLPKGGVGYTEGGTKSLTFDGDLTGKESILVGEVGAETQYLIKLSDITFDTSDFIGATFVSRNITSGEADAKRITDASFEDIGFGYNVRDGENLLFAIVTEDTEAFTKGIWAIVARVDGSWYGCIQIDYNGEIIHHIDPKYLPAGISQSVILEIPYTAMTQLTLGNTIPLDATMAEQIERAGFENRPLYVRAAVTFGEATGFQQIKFDCSVIQSIEKNEQVVMTFVGSIGPIHGHAKEICVTYTREGEAAALASKIAE